MRQILFLILALLPAFVLFSLEIHVAPMLYIDETDGNWRDTSRIQGELLTELRLVETGVVLQFEQLKDNRINPPESLFEAVTVCRNEQIEYLLYGFVTKRAHNVFAEVRLFEYSSRTVLHSFFGMDSHEHHERLIADIANKVLQYVGERFKLDIVAEKKEATRFEIPMIVGYWRPIDSGWSNLMVGTGAAGSGFVFIPSDNIWVIRGMSWYISTGLEVKYRFGFGNPERYDSYNHTLYLTMPVRLHIALTRQHELFAGVGYTYFLEIFLFADKYADSKRYIYNNMGLYSGFGYRFKFDKVMSIFFRNDFDFLFNERSLITYSPTIGVNIQVYEREIRKKW
jgi:hypothetical protein